MSVKAGAQRRVVELRIPAEGRFHAVGRLVAGGIASRFGLDVDRIDDLRLAVDVLLLQPPGDASLELTMTEAEDALDLELGPFRSGADTDGLDRVLRALVDDVTVQHSEHGETIAVRVTGRPISPGPKLPGPVARGGR